MSCISHLWIHVYPFLSFRSTRSAGPIPKTLGHAPGMEATVKLRVRSLQLEMFHWKSPFTSNFNGNSEVWSLAFWQSGEMPKNANPASLGGFMQRRVQVRVLWRCNRGQCSKKTELAAAGRYYDSCRFGCMLHYIYMHEPSPIVSRMNAQNKEHRGRERSLSIQHITPQDTSTTSSNGKGRPEHIVWHTNYSLPCYVPQLYITK